MTISTITQHEIIRTLFDPARLRDGWYRVGMPVMFWNAIGCIILLFTFPRLFAGMWQIVLVYCLVYLVASLERSNHHKKMEIEKEDLKDDEVI